MKRSIKEINKDENYTNIVKYILASIIISMGAYGYYRFFNSTESTEPIWLVIILFIAIEAAILIMTTTRFSSTLEQDKKIGIGLFFSILAMWFISGIGIDQTIWGMIEAKYHKVKLDEQSIIADKESEKLLLSKVTNIHASQNKNTQKLIELKALKATKNKLYEKQARQLKDIIWYNGRRCDLSTDCTARRHVAQNALDLTKSELESYSLSIKILKEQNLILEKNQASTQNKIEDIINDRVNFEKTNRVTLENKADEAIVHVWLMNVLNSFLANKIETPERAYVMLLSFIVYPIYILFVMYMASMSPLRVEKRERLVAEKKKQKLKAEKDGTTLYRAMMLIVKYLRKKIYYSIKTRNRKVITLEIEKEVEVIKEVEKIEYKEGKEIVEIKVEVPHIIEKEVIIEKIIEKPVVEKEFITIPADIDLNEFNKTTGNGTVPTSLEEYLTNINSESKNKDLEMNLTKGKKDDKHRAA